jgi:hypothetical protein
MLCTLQFIYLNKCLGWASQISSITVLSSLAESGDNLKYTLYITYNDNNFSLSFTFIKVSFYSLYSRGKIKCFDGWALISLINEWNTLFFVQSTQLDNCTPILWVKISGNDRRIIIWVHNKKFATQLKIILSL